MKTYTEEDIRIILNNYGFSDKTIINGFSVDEDSVECYLQNESSELEFTVYLDLECIN